MKSFQSLKNDYIQQHTNIYMIIYDLSPEGAGGFVKLLKKFSLYCLKSELRLIADDTQPIKHVYHNKLKMKYV